MGETWMILGKKKTANFRQFIGQIYIYNWSKNLGEVILSLSTNRNFSSMQNMKKKRDHCFLN